MLTFIIFCQLATIGLLVARIRERRIHERYVAALWAAVDELEASGEISAADEIRDLIARIS